MNRKYVIISKTRFTIFITVLALLLVGIINLFSTRNISHGSNEGQGELIEIKVYAGDSLWSIAKENISSKEDIREVVYEIQVINGIGNYIYPGQTILIPKYN